MIHSPRIIVVGSINMDLVATVDSFPQPGETIVADGLVSNPGGKGANQAVAAARLGAQVSLVGCLGNDPFGRELRDSLDLSGVDSSLLQVTDDAPSGTAWIQVDAAGENMITVVPGANSLLRPDHLTGVRHELTHADALLLQLEIPLDTVEAAIELARSAGVPVILDPAPVPRTFPGSLYQVEVLTPNATEAASLLQTAIDAPERAARALHEQGAQQVVLKRGKSGATILDRDGQIEHVAAHRVDAVDTTAAGDAFTAALAVQLARGDELSAATRFAVAAGAVAVTRLGAQQAMPTSEEVIAQIEHSKPDS